MKNILVAGASGLIGNAVVEDLQRDTRVITAGKREGQFHFDIADSNSITKLLTDVGQSVREALDKISLDRMRPILMTSLALIMAELPSILDTGNTYRSLAMVIVGGIALSSVLSMLIIPCFYSLLAQIAPIKPKLDSTK